MLWQSTGAEVTQNWKNKIKYPKKTLVCEANLIREFIVQICSLVGETERCSVILHTGTFSPRSFFWKVLRSSQMLWLHLEEKIMILVTKLKCKLNLKTQMPKTSQPLLELLHVLVKGTACYLQLKTNYIQLKSTLSHKTENIRNHKSSIQCCCLLFNKP